MTRETYYKVTPLPIRLLWMVVVMMMVMMVVVVGVVVVVRRRDAGDGGGGTSNQNQSFYIWSNMLYLEIFIKICGIFKILI